MVQGTASSVGKSLIVAGLCRLLRQEGYRVAPFKAQNMALNAAVTPDGGEIGRSTAVQAEAAGVEPTVEMNPVLLKPEPGMRSQVVLLGRPAGHLAAADFLTRKQALWEHIRTALDHLRDAYDVIVIEGAGSPAEINLRAGDVVNMRVARYAQAPVLLVGDINLGGVFAHLVGTLELLEAEERGLVAGLIINKFRGDASLLASGLTFLEQRTGVPVLGVLPYLPGLRVAEEDAVALEQSGMTDRQAPLDIVVIRHPHIANFDDFDLLAAEPAVRLRFVSSPSEVGRPDLLILPGSKATVADLKALEERGLAGQIIALAGRGIPVLGICGGYQMLGERILDPDGVESAEREATGLALLPAVTAFRPDKRTRQVQVLRGLAGAFAGLDTPVSAYEIHMGQTQHSGTPLFEVRAGAEPPYHDGLVDATGTVAGAYLHGLFEARATRQALIRWLGQRRGLDLAAGQPASREESYDRLAAMLREHLDLPRLWGIVGLHR